MLPGDILIAAAGLAALCFGGELLVRGAAALALRIGISPLAVGLTVVAFGTSAPELVVSVRAALVGSNDIAVGNVVGSNICNVALILGVCTLIRPTTVAATVLRVDAPLMIAASLLLLAFLGDGWISRSEGAVFVVSLVAYTGYTLWQSRREPPEVQAELGGAAPDPSRSLGWSAGLVVAGAAILVAGGALLVGAAIRIATALGVGEALIGLTIVAVGTSLPELATSLVASARGEGDIAIGNVIGSNTFNILGILGVTTIVSPLSRGGIAWSDLGIMLAVAVGLLPLLYSGRQLVRAEGGVLLAAYVAYVTWLVASA